MRTQRRVRLNLAVSPAVQERLFRLQEASKAESFTEVIRRSLLVYEAIVGTVGDGGRVILESAEGTQESLRLLW